MPSAAKYFRVFVSSTFSDLQHERNALQERVFPKLRQLCEERGARFQAIDLRWGISEEASQDQRALNACLAEIERCQYFIVLLGDRYGWRPTPPEIPAPEFNALIQHLSPSDQDKLHARYRLDENIIPPDYVLKPREGEFKDYRKWAETEQELRTIFSRSAVHLFSSDQCLKYLGSATEQEIRHMVRKLDAALGNTFCFFRKIKDLPEDISAQNFLDLNPSDERDKDAYVRLETLKQQLRRDLPHNIHEYESEWTGNGITTAHIDQLCYDVYTQFSNIIQEELRNLQEVDVIRQEADAHAEFGRERARHFVGRADMLAAIAQYLQDSSSQPLAILGDSGMGKSTLMAKAIEQTQTIYPHAAILYRFVGVTPESSSGWLLLDGLCQEIAETYHTNETQRSATYEELVRTFQARLALASAEQPLVLWLDALDQLPNKDRALRLDWLLSELPPYVKVIVSSLPNLLPTLEAKISEDHRKRLALMPQHEGAMLLDMWLAEAQRNLQPYQREMILSHFARSGGLPLYLKLAFEESRSWRSYDPPVELGANVNTIIQNLFARLTMPANHGKLLVERSLAYLAAAKNGLAEDELLDVLSRDTELFDDFQAQAQHVLPEPRLPVVVWSRLYSELAPYLTERGADDAFLLTFYHRQFADVVAKSYLGESVRQVRHRHLARNFLKNSLSS